MGFSTLVYAFFGLSLALGESLLFSLALGESLLFLGGEGEALSFFGEGEELSFFFFAACYVGWLFKFLLFDELSSNLILCSLLARSSAVSFTICS